MKKRKDYNFISYDDEIRHQKNIKNIKLILTIFVVLITAILILITRNIQLNIDNSKESTNIAIMQTEIERDKLIKAEEELAKEKEEIEKKEKLEQEKQEREEKLPKLTAEGKENMSNIYHFETKRAFLTFDDGPSNITPQILDTLKQENVKATFFMLGSNVVNFPETTKRVYNEGHYIANHGYTHEYSSVYASPQAVLDEFNMCNDAVRKVLGEPQYNSHLFRFPGGLYGGKYAQIKQEAKQLLEQNDILNVDWNALTGDAETQHPVADTLMQKLKSTVEGKSSVVILMHDAQAKKVTADMLSDIITYLREQGYEFKTFYDIIK